MFNVDGGDGTPSSVTVRRSRSSVGAQRCGGREALGRGAAGAVAAGLRTAGRADRLGAAFFLAAARVDFGAALRVFLAAALTLFFRPPGRPRDTVRRLAERAPVARRVDLAVALRAPRAFLFAMDSSFRDLDKMS